MKAAPTHGSICCLAIILAASGASCLAQAQTQNPAPSIEILKLKWERQVRLPRNFDPSVIPAGGAFSDPARSTSTAANAAPVGGLPATQSNPDVAFPSIPGRLPVVYVYSLKIRNSSAKTIEGVAWDYYFIDQAGNKEVGRHQFLSYERVLPNKGTTFHALLRSPPVRLVQLPPQRKKSSKPLERAMVQCVLYADNTVWRNPAARSGICEFLANQRSLLKKKRASAESLTHSNFS